MEQATISARYQLLIPKSVREQLGLRPGQKMAVITKGRVVIFVPQVPPEQLEGVARGVRMEGLRDEEDEV